MAGWELVDPNDPDEIHNNSLPSALRLPADVMARRRAVKVFTNSWQLAVGKQGKNDIDVEIYRNGDWVPGNLTSVRKGEVFQLISQAGELTPCFACQQPARNVGGNDKHNPSLMLGVVEIVVRPTINITHMQDNLLESEKQNDQRSLHILNLPGKDS